MDAITGLIHFMMDLVTHVRPTLETLLARDLTASHAILFAIIFCETGLVVTPFLPGDSLLFALGALAAATGSSLSLPLLAGLLIGAAVLGDAVNYAIGWRLGPKVFKYESSWLLNKKHLFRAQEFYEQYGNKTIVLARFVPIVRTFAPFVAGIGQMQYRRFAIYNVAGGVAWVALCLFSGFFFGRIEWVDKHFEAVLVAIVLISVLPMAIEYLLSRRRAALAKTSNSVHLTDNGLIKNHRGEQGMLPAEGASHGRAGDRHTQSEKAGRNL